MAVQTALVRLAAHPQHWRGLMLAVALSAARIFLEAFRSDSVIWVGGFQAAQVIALLVLAISLL